MIAVTAPRRLRIFRFGRRRPFTYAVAAARAAPSISDDVRLFLSTFVGGLLFMTVYLA